VEDEQEPAECDGSAWCAAVLSRTETRPDRATAGNLINYLQVTKADAPPQPNPQSAFQSAEDEERYWREESQWHQAIPGDLVSFGEQFEAEEAAAQAHEDHNRRLRERGLPVDPMPFFHNVLPSIPPPSLPAQLQRGVLTSASASGDDNSILPKPDHSVIDHLAASPISKGLLSVAITKRYRRKFVTTIFYKVRDLRGLSLDWY
jgi:hypothetical protein